MRWARQRERFWRRLEDWTLKLHYWVGERWSAAHSATLPPRKPMTPEGFRTAMAYWREYDAEALKRPNAWVRLQQGIK